MKKLVIRDCGTRKFVAGTVKKVNTKAFENGEVTYMTLEGEVYNTTSRQNEKKEVTLEFRDSDFGIIYYGNEEATLLNQKIKKCSIEEGAFISIIGIQKKKGDVEIPDTYIVNQFKFKGLWKIKATETTKEQNILIGNVLSPTDDQEGRFWKCSVPVNVSKDETKWIQVTFWNNEGNSLGENAKKILSPTEGENGTVSKKALIICGEERINSYNGKEYSQMTGYSFELI